MGLHVQGVDEHTESGVVVDVGGEGVSGHGPPPSLHAPPAPPSTHRIPSPADHPTLRSGRPAGRTRRRRYSGGWGRCTRGTRGGGRGGRRAGADGSNLNGSWGVLLNAEMEAPAVISSPDEQVFRLQVAQQLLMTAGVSM